MTPYCIFSDYRSSESDIDEDELDNLLNEGLPEDLRSHKKDIPYEERFKTVLEGKTRSSFASVL